MKLLEHLLPISIVLAGLAIGLGLAIGAADRGSPRSRGLAMPTSSATVGRAPFPAAASSDFAPARSCIRSRIAELSPRGKAGSAARGGNPAPRGGGVSEAAPPGSPRSAAEAGVPNFSGTSRDAADFPRRGRRLRASAACAPLKSHDGFMLTAAAPRGREAGERRPLEMPAFRRDLAAQTFPPARPRITFSKSSDLMVRASWC